MRGKVGVRDKGGGGREERRRELVRAYECGDGGGRAVLLFVLLMLFQLLSIVI